MSGPRTSHRAGSVDHLLGAGLCVAYVALLLLTTDGLALSRDESMYVHAAESYAAFYEALVRSPERALARSFIDRRFEINHEHPALAKTLFGLSYLLEKHTGVFGSRTTAHRFPGMVCAGLLLWLLYIMGTHYGGRTVGAGAALSYALLPRAFYHAHLNCFDVPITLAVTACAYTYTRALLSRRWLVGCGLAFGAALATKHNSWVLPGIFAIHFLWVQLNQRRHGQHPVGAVPTFLVAMALLGPPVLVATWPWLWHDGWSRFAWYARFHLHHAYYNMAYFGMNYFRPPFPFSYPWVMTAITVPVTTLFLSLAGLACELRAVVAAWRARRARDPQERAVLWLGAMLTPLLMIALPSTPIFGGTKHWLTAYPFLCLFAGLGLRQVVLGARSALPWARTRIGRPVVYGGLLTVLFAPAAVETHHSHPFALSHYGGLAGGVPGAADLGMNRQFWGFTTGSLADFFRRAMPDGGRVFVCDTTHTAFLMFRDDAHLSPRLRPTGDLRKADYALVHHEHHFDDVDFQIWTVYGTVRPTEVLTYDGVPVISVYRNPDR